MEYNQPSDDAVETSEPVPSVCASEKSRQVKTFPCIVVLRNRKQKRQMVLLDFQKKERDRERRTSQTTFPQENY